ncbi:MULTISPECIES: type II toxin-antitoxin system RelE/ParE family toxin [Achromobacter]|uniref:Type II toxin-antitoxin system RelE/ParE family toxin n=1 Tax=Achromobacter spanius TaxID=217203 RepID=A0ABY8GLY5_9BURK|nr:MULTISPECIES: type II toxin-antitoxin system RelE/ParE family toxin [Achromobacter]WAI85120.1 type II toxin-antitoxin system RelE/ParE family toxin [Achromobacter spanius]WEX95202.1 type II toxin-antitoxin system RelE/ParE family toxin [Achromobacter sp. SS2-2022]WFP05628.1 type II toxin-antitoxin system RelE/ParE family toxin [Achromobacter spanius]
MLPIFWSASALDDLDEITNYIAEYDVHAAIGMHELIENAVHPASEHPYLYRPGRVPGTREIVAHPNYILVYEVRADHIGVIAVMHARQEYP